MNNAMAPATMSRDPPPFFAFSVPLPRAEQFIHFNAGSFGIANQQQMFRITDESPFLQEPVAEKKDSPMMIQTEYSLRDLFSIPLLLPILLFLPGLILLRNSNANSLYILSAS